MIRQEDRTIRLTVDLSSIITDAKNNRISASEGKRKPNINLKLNFAVSVRDLITGLNKSNKGFIVSHQRDMEVAAQEWVGHHKTQVHSHASALLSLDCGFSLHCPTKAPVSHKRRTRVKVCSSQLSQLPLGRSPPLFSAYISLATRGCESLENIGFLLSIQLP